MNRDWTGKLQVIILSAEINYTRTLFGGSNRDAFLENEVKIHERECLKEFFFVNRLTSSQRVFSDFKYLLRC